MGGGLLDWSWIGNKSVGREKGVDVAQYVIDHSKVGVELGCGLAVSRQDVHRFEMPDDEAALEYAKSWWTHFCQKRHKQNPFEIQTFERLSKVLCEGEDSLNLT